MKIKLIAALLIVTALAVVAAPHLVVAPPPVAPPLHVVVVQADATTTEGATTIVNLDVVSNLPTTAIKRYTVTISLPFLAFASPGTDFIEVRVGVLSGSTSWDVRVLYADTSDYAYPGAPGTIVPTYTGTDSFIRFIRGSDGFGDVTVHVNAYIEFTS